MKKFTFLFITTLLISLSSLKAQQSGPSSLAMHVDSTQVCYGYYITNDSQKVQATFVINNNPGYTKAQRVENLQYSITVLQKDSSLKVFKPGEIKGYRILNWGKTASLLAYEEDTLFPYRRRPDITKTTAEFESVSANNRMGIVEKHGRGKYFFYVSKKAPYINTYLWWGAYARKGDGFRPYGLSSNHVLFNKTTKIAFGPDFNARTSDIISDYPLLKKLVKRRILIRLEDMDLILSEYEKWKHRQDMTDSGKVSSPLLSQQYLHRNSDTSFVLKAAIDARKRYLHSGIFWASFLFTSTIIPGIFPYAYFILKSKPKLPKGFQMDTTSIAYKDYIKTYERKAKYYKKQLLTWGGTIGLMGFDALLIIYENDKK